MARRGACFGSAPLLEQDAELVQLDGRGKPVALSIAASQLFEALQLGSIFDAFGHQIETQRARQSDDGADDLGGLVAGRQTGYEGAVDLDRIEGKPLQIVEGRVA